jgi:glycosyltransferase involved in cell wall biosynthesis
MIQGRFPHSLSVFFPAYNDAPSLAGLIGRTFAVLNEHVEDFEVIVVNDGSRDQTGKVLTDLQGKHGERLRVITHSENRGYGGALRSGFLAASREFVFYTDGDGQYDVAELPRLLARMEADVCLVNGYKIARRDPWHRIAIGFLYNQFARTLFRIRLRDIDCDFRLIRRRALDPEGLTCTSGTICVELVKKLESCGMRISEVPVSHYPRAYGRSQFFRVKALATTAGQLWWLFGRYVLGGGMPGGSARPAAEDVSR